MHALIVVAHHDPQSLTHSVAAEVGAGLSASGHTFEIADLAAEGFDPRYSAADHRVHRTRATPPADVVAEQARIDRADALVLAFPIYWWSMPALLKGWVDRVFVNGWAIDYGPDTPVQKKLRHLQVHLLALGGADDSAFERHGYAKAMNTQIDYGIFDYCGARVLTSELLLDSESGTAQAHLHKARAVGQGLFEREAVAG
ncbi:NAD(P)H-dependent oxidoreductase [Pseudomonas fluorescens]|uniref:NAD(P)H-dependent oxidoreductase n=1 Tax=Pseudomonas TaxID=286 RepID=UPI00025E8C07|nr:MULTISPECIES: NAD(P)H-dependent oxidoreductase [Pseudomonas]AFJ55750.1 NAD(P)H quinone oxidoreductase, quinone family [Pseudomonas fluorescens A506]AOS74142.1 NAD(P)H dehydrogenase [Pseudomonas fluorescens]NLT88243.1 NAD(P)H-dependent oxidoreductase [Pseudomonas lactis]AIB42298.1 NAD(P)H dehydrogenase [Pseudomonas sp. WCS374]MBD8258415.1 NAD(P)H-dependent oxidoreductase [Pseudomonas fluorescens]